MDRWRIRIRLSAVASPQQTGELAQETVPADVRRSYHPPAGTGHYPGWGRLCQAVAGAGCPFGTEAWRRSRRRRSCAFAATMIVDRLIATAPTLIGSTKPSGAKSPAATGIARAL